MLLLHMALKSQQLYLVVLLLLSLCNHNRANTNTQSADEFFNLARKSLSGPSLSNWDDDGSSSSVMNKYCNYTGVACDEERNVLSIDVSGWSLSGKIPDEICSYLPQLRVLRLGSNSFNGGFPRGITNCAFLQELNMSRLYLSGPVPDLSPLKSLRVLDLSYNLFTGDFPVSIINLTGLEFLSFNENGKFNKWKLPENISVLSKLKFMILTSCMLYGEIPASIGNMTSLIDLELSGNYLTGRVPKELGSLKNLVQLELYYNELEGEIPRELGNLTQLTDLDMSVNKFTGEIPESICNLPKLRVFQLYNNSLTGEIPGVIANSTTLKTMSLYSNFLTGEVPRNLGESSDLVGLDLSENQLYGKLPESLCSGKKLNYLLLLQNNFSGEIPISYGDCSSLIRFRINDNNLYGKIPEGIFSLPHVSIIDVSNNNLSGSVSKSIQYARNLSQLFLQGNKISGLLPPEVAGAVNLVKIDLSNNLLSGPIPSEIGNLRLLNVLMLANNELDSSIPKSLSNLKSINLLDLSSNRLTGSIPESLGDLLPNSLNFSNNLLSGPVPLSFVKGGVLESFSGNPNLCVPAANTDPPASSLPVCPQSYNRRKVNFIWVVGISVGIVIVGTILFLKRWLQRDKAMSENEESMSSSFFSYDVKSFHRLSFDQREIIESMVDKNIVGYGGSGTVYKIELNNGETVAVKKLWSRKATKDMVPPLTTGSGDVIALDKELKTEVETLGSVRHKNIVKLYCYFSSSDCSLLVYEYMTNGNLWDALRREKDALDWPTRHGIALGIAQGLAYLHHDLMPPIVHRDIKSTNILLDVDYHPKVADFGIAKVLQARGSKDYSSMTDIVGTYGYLAPEYAYSSKATTKCDVYSFGVVLMELITGKKPVEPEFGENKNIIYWVSTKVETKEGVSEVLDKRVSSSYREDMIKALKIAIRCTSKQPALRPTMNEVVQMIAEADPCKFNCCNKFSNNEDVKDTTANVANTTKPKNQFDV